MPLFAGLLLSSSGLSYASAADYVVIHNFPAIQHDGADPYADVQYAGEYLYGTTAKGGGNANAGTIFKIAPDGSETILHAFTGKTDGNYPYGITLDRLAGDVFGITGTGGVTSDICPGGCGVIYKLSSDGSFSVLHSFNYNDGNIPVGRLIRDSSGNFYGATELGGASSNGTIFKLTANGSFSILHNFAGGMEGGNPNAGLQKDKVGNLYGTAFGGAHGYGVVFRLAPNGTYSVLHAFSGGNDGAYPFAALERDQDSNLYGTTEKGGPKDAGTIFKIAADETFTQLYTFTGGADGKQPQAHLLNMRGVLYGTTFFGGSGQSGGYGIVFKVLPDGTFSVLHTFTNADGASPYAGLIKGKHGVLYGTTFGGGSNGYGVVFSLPK